MLHNIRVEVLYEERYQRKIFEMTCVAPGVENFKLLTNLFRVGLGASHGHMMPRPHFPSQFNSCSDSTIIVDLWTPMSE